MQLGNYRWDQDVAMEVLEKIGLAVVILLATWVAARAAKWAFAKLVDKISFFQRGTGSGRSLGESLGEIVSLLIWLFGLLVLLTVLGLASVADPINALLANVVDFIPNLVGAGLIFFIGLMVAKIVRDLVTTTLQTVDFDKWANRGGVDTVTGNSTISKTIGTVIYAIIVVFVSILALDALNLDSVMAPASNMLQLIFDAIPRIIGAAILLGIGYVISRFVVEFLKEILAGLGVDRSLQAAEILPHDTRASSVIARVVQVAIILFFAIAATRLLGFPELTALLNEVLELGGKVVFGAVVIGVGFLLANMLQRIIDGAESGSSAGSIVKWATIILFTFMGLSFTGVGDIITETAFTAIVIGVSVAGALAFGLGGREWAARKLEQMDDAAGDGVPPAPKPPRRRSTKGSEDPLPPGA
ncbi:mechanosensitive ion channel [Blastomonas marina]|uniref:mechanosensitive ion channel n=1 Tax=Blastomonas marina TaxID=1867408 RepID=UPI002AC97FA7|nr:mechanosensitive ion channel [Blastomonas marina]WPZ03163.1 mechanosensitive ion channel [Blastomonas marina]